MSVGGGGFRTNVSYCLFICSFYLLCEKMFFEFNSKLNFMQEERMEEDEEPLSTATISDLSAEILVIVLSFLHIEDLSRYLSHQLSCFTRLGNS
jgi:hypothetical protein